MELIYNHMVVSVSPSADVVFKTPDGVVEESFDMVREMMVDGETDIR